MAARLKTVTVSVASRDNVTGRALSAFRGEAQGAHISFASADLLWRTITRERWALLQVMTGQGAMSTAEAAIRAGRHPSDVQLDIDDLLVAGILDREGEKVAFPFDAVHVDFTLTKAA